MPTGGTIPLAFSAHSLSIPIMSSTTTAKRPKAAPRKVRTAATASFAAPLTTLARIDGKGRVTLGAIVQPGEQFTIYREPSGNIVLQPVKIVPANEAWLWENKTALAAVLQGMREAEEGKTQDLGDFTRYAKE